MRCVSCGRGMEDEAGDECWRCREIEVAGEAPVRPREARREHLTVVPPEPAQESAESDTAKWLAECRRILNETRDK